LGVDLAVVGFCITHQPQGSEIAAYGKTRGPPFQILKGFACWTVFKNLLDQVLQAKPSNFGLADFYYTIALVNHLYIRSRLAQALYINRKRLIS
jgi:hypothetical protein